MGVLVGKKAPHFSAGAVINGGEVVSNFSLDQFIGKNPVVLFFYPKDFTFVCPSELHAFQSKLAEFEARGAKVVACSTDTEESHWGWLQVPKNKGGIEGVTYPILADTNRNLSSVLDILDIQSSDFNEELDTIIYTGSNVTYRATYLIDEDGTVFHESVNHMPLGRNVNEFLRLIDAYSHVQNHGEVCPANWQSGDDAMNATRDGVSDYLGSH
jgi:peroxiredoxin (alkyl hydroperoxide reductase subunit C)